MVEMVTFNRVKDWIKDFGFPKLLILPFVFYLLFEEFNLYMKIKPTQTSISEKTIGKSLNPNIFICKSPEFNNEVFEQHGYTDAYWYSIGNNLRTKFVGWIGNNSMKVEDILEDIVSLKLNDTLPAIRLKLKEPDGRVWFEQYKVKLEHTRVMYPYGRCLKVIYPSNAVNSSLNGFIIQVKTAEDNGSYWVILERESGMCLSST